MIENLMNLVKQCAGDAIVNNSDIPNEKNDAAIETASNGIFSGLQGLAAGGGLNQILGMFTGGQADGNAQTALPGMW